MPGWIIQGVRGEGKSLAAVYKIREYLLQGRPVATNLDLYLDKLLPDDNKSLCYRLPDHPRLEDFQLLPPAFDPKYKGEDHNGLLVLDELGTWLNSRNWTEKSRLKMLNWLFLSRKDHWDIVLLAQDYEMIDNQVRNTLCDYLVQASRLDRQKIPYISGIMKFLGFSGKMFQLHRYHVFYGFNMQNDPDESWSFRGHDIWHGYDTNQRFKDGIEAVGDTLVDMRATYTYLPAAYLSNHVHIEKLQNKIKQLSDYVKDREAKEKKGGEIMAIKGVGSEGNYLKIGLLAFGLVVFLGWRFLSGGFNLPNTSAIIKKPVDVSQSKPELLPSSIMPEKKNDPVQPVSYQTKAIETQNFIDYLISNYRPRLSVTAFDPERGFFGNVEFYDNGQMVEQYSISDLHSLGVVLVRKPYGADLIYKGKSYILTNWKLPAIPEKTNELVADNGKL